MAGKHAVAATAKTAVNVISLASLVTAKSASITRGCSGMGESKLKLCPFCGGKQSCGKAKQVVLGLQSAENVGQEL